MPQYTEVEINREQQQYGRHKHSDIIWKTQLHNRPNNKGHIYKDIMASIGLDSPCTSMKEDAIDHVGDKSLVDIPIRNSAFQPNCLRPTHPNS